MRVNAGEAGSCCLLSLLEAVAAQRPDAAAMLSPGERAQRSYRTLLAELRAVGAQLHTRGLAGDARVAVITPDSADLAVLLLGLMGYGTALPMNPRMPAEELARSLRVLGAKAVVTAGGKEGEGARRVAQDLSLPMLEMTELLTASGSSDASTPSPRGGTDVALIVCTSGTTGRPKIVPLTHNNVLSMMLANCGVLGLDTSDRCLSVMPLYHIHGLGAVLCSLLSGGSVVVTAGFAGDAFFEWLRQFAPTWYTAVPTIHQAIMERAAAHQDVVGAIVARGGLKLVRSGSAPMPAGVPERLEALFHTTYIEASGATEASAYICSNRPGKRRIGSVGLPMPGTEVRVIDEQNRPMGPGVTGELVARGPGIFAGYEGDPQATAAAFVDGFFRTGDLACYDEDGFFYITGRIKEQINRGGMKVSPGEVDAVLAQHPAVAQAVTFAVPDQRLGQEVAAAVVLKSGVAAPTELELQRHAASRLADYKVPRRIVLVSEIPRGGSGKVRRVDLAERLGITTAAPGVGSVEPVAGPPSPVESAPSTPHEQAIAAIWSDVLSAEVTDANAPFFALGGDSLQAVELCVALERRFGRSVPLAALTARPTIRGIAALLGDDGLRAAPGEPIVLREGTPGGPTLFVLPGVGGNIYSYHGLARRLPQAWRVVGLPLPGADGMEPPLTSMDALADRFLAAMELQRQHDGPYAICGYSFGGRVAFEVARRLHVRGLPVPVLISFDTPAPGWPPPLPLGQRIGLHLNRIRQDGLIPALRRMWAARRARHFGGTEALPDAVLDTVRLPNTTEERRAQQDAVLSGCRMASRSWRPRPTPLRLHLFRAVEPVWGHCDVSDRTMGWSRLVTGGVEVTDVPGNHGTIFHEPYVAALAQRLTSLLENEEHERNEQHQVGTGLVGSSEGVS